MKKLLAIVAVCLLAVSVYAADKTANQTDTITSISAATGTTTGDCYRLKEPSQYEKYYPFQVVRWWTEFSGTPTAITVVLKGKVSGGAYFTLDTSTSTAGESRVVSNAQVDYVCADITAYTVNGSTATVKFKAFPPNAIDVAYPGVSSPAPGKLTLTGMPSAATDAATVGYVGIDPVRAWREDFCKATEEYVPPVNVSTNVSAHWYHDCLGGCGAATSTYSGSDLFPSPDFLCAIKIGSGETWMYIAAGDLFPAASSTTRVFETVIKAATVDAGSTHSVGLCAIEAASDDGAGCGSSGLNDEGVLLQFTANGVWHLYTRDASGVTDVATTVAGSTATTKVRIEYSSTSVKAYLNGVLVATSTTHISTLPLSPNFHSKKGTATNGLTIGLTTLYPIP